MKIVIPLFHHFTTLDAMGPCEVLSRIPNVTVVLAGAQRGLCTTELGFPQVRVDTVWDEVPRPDVVVVPGGPGARPHLQPHLVNWLKRVHPHTRWMSSVCTGALLLGGAGILEGRQATTHWQHLETLASHGATVVRQRVVPDGKLLTSAGVSAGLDMALTLAALLAGDKVAQAIQLQLEYDPAPPFDAGSPDKAPPDVVAMVRAGGLSRAHGSTA